MDAQHQKLIAMINHLIAEQKNVTAPETIAELGRTLLQKFAKELGIEAEVDKSSPGP